MPTTHTKICPRCENVFECNPGNIKECQCSGFQLTSEQRDIIQRNFNDCLCTNCLIQLQNEFRQFREDLPKGKL